MSAYKTVKTKMTDVNMLAAALEGVKPKLKGKVKIAEPGKHVSISGDRSMEGEIVIQRREIGTYADIGVTREKDGTLTVHVSDVDAGTYYKDAAKREKEGNLYDAKFVQQVQQHYALIEGVLHGQSLGAQTVSAKTELSGVPGLTGKVVGVRMAIPRSKVVQITG